MWDKIADTLVAQGISGIANVVEGLVIYYLIQWVRDLLKQLNDLQEKRVTERDAALTASIRTADALDDVTTATEAANKALNDNTRAIEYLTRNFPPRGP